MGTLNFDFGHGIKEGDYAHQDLCRVLLGSYAHERMPKRPRLVVDVGANVGAFSRWARGTFPDAAIVAIEPMAETHDILRRNLAGRCVTTLPIGASDRDGARELHAGLNTLGECSFEDLGQQHRFAVRRVNIDRIDHLVTSPPDILKIDTEGHEIQVLAGCGELLKGVGYVALEVHRFNDNHTIDAMLFDAGLEEVERKIEHADPYRAVVKYARRSS